jgi:hypothetical protein
MRIILRWMLDICDMKSWSGFIWLRLGKVVKSFECGNEFFGSIKCGVFLD